MSSNAVIAVKSIFADLPPAPITTPWVVFGIVVLMEISFASYALTAYRNPGGDYNYKQPSLAVFRAVEVILFGALTIMSAFSQRLWMGGILGFMALTFTFLAFVVYDPTPTRAQARVIVGIDAFVALVIVLGSLTLANNGIVST
jgi:hypothetical protein